MEVMAVPNKELLIFYNQIDEWVDRVYPDQDKPLVSFKQGTPKSILDLFDTIKSKIGFDYAVQYKTLSTQRNLSAFFVLRNEREMKYQKNNLTVWNPVRFFYCPSIEDTKSYGKYSRGRL